MNHQDDAWERYFAAARNLRSSIERNAADADFAGRDNTKIVYIFDASIFVYEADVNDTHRLTEDIDSLVGVGEQQNQIARTFERLTASFLFSGKLPGQKDGRVFMTLPHLAESFSVARAIADKIDQYTLSEPSPFEKEEVRAEIAEIFARPITADTIKELGQILPTTWLSTLNAKAHFKRVLHQAFSAPGMLKPLSDLERGKMAAELRHDDVQPWLNVMPDPDPLRRTLETIRADALSLATITNLYRDDPGSRGPKPERQYLLVTSDRAIFNAVRRRLPVLQAQGIPNFVRLPEDYLPLLNLSTMSIALSQVPSDTKLQQAFRNVFSSLRMAVDWIALVERDSKARNATFLRNKDPLQYLQETWRSISAYITVLNIPYARDAAWLFADLRKNISHDFKEVAAELVETSVMDVSDKHLILVLEATLSEIKRDELSQSRLRKVHLQALGDSFTTLVAGESLPTYLEGVFRAGELTTSVRAAIGNDGARAEVQLLAACIFIAGNRWNLATEAASRGLRSLEQLDPQPSARYDARYLVAHCCRFSMRSEAELRRAKRLLEQNLQVYASQARLGAEGVRRRLRDEIEYGSLLITAAILEALAPTAAGRLYLGADTSWSLFPSVHGNAHGYLTDGVRRLRVALEKIDDEATSPGDATAASSLRRQVITNLVEALLFERIGPGLQGDLQLFNEDAQELVEQLGRYVADEDATRSLLLTHQIYYWRSRYLLGATFDDRAHSREMLMDALSLFKKDYRLPLIDMVEFQFIEDQLLDLNAASEGTDGLSPKAL